MRKGTPFQVAPTLFQIGRWEIRSYPVLLALGVLAGVWLGWREAARIGYSRRQMTVFLAVIIPLALLVGMVNGWLFSPDFAWGIKHGRLVLSGGMVSYGIVFTVLAGTAVSTQINRGPMGRSLDAAALVLPVMLGFTRIGCLLNGCCYGLPTIGPGGVFLPDVYGEWARRYPTQWMLLGLDLLLFAGLWLYRKHRPADGKAAMAFLFWFGLGRLLIDSLRDLPAVLGKLSYHQLADMAILLMATLLVGWKGWLHRSPPHDLLAEGEKHGTALQGRGAADIHDEVMGSDHCPVSLVLDL